MNERSAPQLRNLPDCRKESSLRDTKKIMTAASEILHHQDKDNTNIYCGMRRTLGSCFSCHNSFAFICQSRTP